VVPERLAPDLEVEAERTISPAAAEEMAHPECPTQAAAGAVAEVALGARYSPLLAGVAARVELEAEVRRAE
jgi:hypothetical protein